jgi:ATP-binding cassette, subfamily B, bacterial
MRTRSPAVLLVRRLPRVSAPLTTALAALIGTQVAASAAFMLAVGQLMRLLAGAGPAGGRTAEREVLVVLVAVAGLFALDVTTTPVRDLVATRLGLAVEGLLAQLTIEGALRPKGIAHLDDPAVADRLQLAKGVGGGGWSPRGAVPALAFIVPVRLAGATAVVLLGCSGGWWMPLVVGTAWVVTGRWQDRRVDRAVTAHAGQTAALRRAAYLREMATGPAAAKEVRIFGLQGWLIEQFTRTWWAGMAELRAAGTRWREHAAAIGLLGAAHLAVVVPLGLAAAHGDLPVSRLTVALQAVVGMSALGWIGDLGWQLRMATTAVPHALAVADLGDDGDEPTAARAAPARAAGGRPERDIRFRSVGFAYPGERRPVLDRFDLTVPAGSSLALVGDNGAGKSTVVKLLAGLYRPTGGQILVDGVDLHAYDLDAWRRQLAVVFQDFVHYPLSARENIAVGYVEAPPSDAAVEAAARRGGFAGIETALASGWDTPLSPAYAGGTDLSGGQWQRLALARALFAVQHGARVLVLDEPTAHLDVRAEHALYQRFLQLTAGVTTILVSHRFATVRLADRIAVLTDGRISEYGNHDDLVAAGGRYAKMFALQAQPFAAADGAGHA